MAKYQQLKDDIQQQIEAGIWPPGTKLPSLREQVTQRGVSLMTVMHAYEVLESQGWIVSRPQSGYYVAPRALQTAPAQVAVSEQVDINNFVFEVLQAIRDPAVLPFGSAFPDPELFPQRQLMRSLTNVSRQLTPDDALHNLPPGNLALRQMLAQRYARQGIMLSPDEIVITSGALEALNLSLQSLTEPGDYVVIEQPTFYGALQAIERLKLKALAVPSDPRLGIDLQQLEETLQRWPVRACWLMTTLQNPTGVTLPPARKAELVALLARYQVPLIEDDVYAELWSEATPPLPAKYWDRQGNVLHCGSFSKSLVAGFRVGWVAAGEHAQRIQRLQLMSTLSTSAPMQLAIADFLTTRRYDVHLKTLRQALARRKSRFYQALRAVLPADASVHDMPGGYFLWITLPEGYNTTLLYQRALEQQISIAPGQLFSAEETLNHCFRLNTSWPWDSRAEAAIATLGQLIAGLQAD